MLSNSDSTIVVPYFSRSSNSRFLYPASRSFVCRFVRVVFASIFVSRLFDCRFVCRYVCRYVECRINFSVFVSILFVGIVLGAVTNEFRRFSK